MTDYLPASSDLAGLREVLARAEAEGRAVTFVYAPTTIHHHTTAAPVPRSAPAPVVLVQPVTAGGGRGTGHPGIDVDLTGYGEFVPPTYVTSLPPQQGPQARSWAPMVLLVSGWSGIGAVFATAVTGSAFAIACVAVALVVSAGAFSVVYRDNQ